MKKQALPLLAVVGGAVAFVLRLVQNRTGFEASTGLPIPGNVAGILLVLWLLAMAVLLILLARKLPKESEPAPAFPADFAASDSRLLAVPVTGILLMALSGLADLIESFGSVNLLAQMQATADPYAEAAVSASVFSGKLQLLMGLLSLACAACLFLGVTACRRGEREVSEVFQGGTLLLIPPVVLVIRLVLTYRVDSVDPALEAYYVELLALVFLSLGFYRLSSFAFQAGRTGRFSLYACAAIILSMAALADGGPHLSSLLLYAGGAATLLGFLLLRLVHTDAD